MGKIMIGLVAILICVSVSGCNSKPSTPEEKILGKWHLAQDDNLFTYHFFGNGSLFITVSGYTITWWNNYSITETTLGFTSILGDNEIYEYTFSSDNQKLLLTDITDKNITLLLERQ